MAKDQTIPVTGEPQERLAFQLTSLQGNNNKFWKLERWDAGAGLSHVRVRYGRVGTAEQVSNHPSVSSAWIARKVAEKVGKGYVEVQLAQVAPGGQPVTALAVTNDPVQAFVARIFREAGEQIKSYLAVAVDALGQPQIARGRQLLQDIQTAWAMYQRGPGYPGARDGLVDLTQQFYNAIPTQLPRRIDPWQAVTELCGALSEQEDRLNQLEAAIATQAAATGQVTQLSALGSKLALLDQRDPLWNRIAHYVTSTASRHHGYTRRPEAIYEVEIPQERAAYLADATGKGRRELLFHGSAAGYTRHILRTGLIVPRHAANGRAFGDGIYFARDSTKSVNYCSARYGGKILYLAEVAVGRAYTPRVNTEVRTAKAAPAGHDSVWAKVRETAHLQHDEIIVYRTSQQTIRYAVELQ